MNYGFSLRQVFTQYLRVARGNSPNSAIQVLGFAFYKLQFFNKCYKMTLQITDWQVK